ncbi:MAG: hypothetical protein ACFHX7_16810 [Pseudomonadota bacterium]
MHNAYMFSDSLALFSRTWILLAVLAAGGASGREADPRAELALGNTLYHYYLNEPEMAYARASYYQKRGIGQQYAREILLTQAGLALDMGLHGEASRLIEAIDPSSLSADNRDQLHYFLAREAHRRGDLARLGAQLNQIDTRSALLKGGEGRFLASELQRLRGDLPAARSEAWRIPRDNVFASYALYNLGVSAWQYGEEMFAMDVLSRLVRSKAGTLEQALLQERGKLAMANIALSSSSTNSKSVEIARRSLQDITTTTHYGPMAVARLAQLEMNEARYAEAARLWQFLVVKYPWHEAARQAHVGLAYAIELSSGQAPAFLAYREAARRLMDRSEQLALAREQIKHVSPMQLAHALVERDTEPELIASLSDMFGHDDWSRWLVSEDTIDLALRLRRFGLAEARLQQHQQDLGILLGVDAERQSQIRDNAMRLARHDYLKQLAQQRCSLAAQQAMLDAARRGESSPVEFATQSERRLLARLDQLKETLDRFPSRDRSHQRLARLKGRVTYTIADSLPVRIRQQEARLEVLLADLAKAEGRAQRVLVAAHELGEAGSVSQRINLLSDRTSRLLESTRHAVEGTGQLLIAGLLQGLEREAAAIEGEVTYARLAMARLGDARLLAAEVHP